MFPLNDIITVFTGGKGEDAVVFERREDEIQKKNLRALVVDKQKRIEELSKFCTELRAKEHLRRKKKEKKLLRKKTKTKDKDSILQVEYSYDNKHSTCPNRSIEIEDFILSPELDSAPSSLAVKEAKEAITSPQYANHDNGDDRSSINVDLQTAKTKNEKKVIEIDCVKDHAVTKKREMNPNSSSENNPLDPSGSVRNILSVETNREQMSIQAKKSITTHKKQCSDKGGPTPATPLPIFSWMDYKIEIRDPVSIQSKRDLCKSDFHRKDTGTHRPLTRLRGQKQLGVNNDTSMTPNARNGNSVDLNLASSIASSDPKTLEPSIRTLDGSNQDMEKAGEIVGSKRKWKPTKGMHSISTSTSEERKENNRDMYSNPSMDSPPSSSLDPENTNKDLASIQSKRDLFESVFRRKAQGIPQPQTSQGGKQLDIESDSPATHKTLKQGFVELNLASFGSKPSNLQSSKPSKRVLDGSDHEKDRLEVFIASAVALLFDKSLESEIRCLVFQIDRAGGFPMTRRLSLRDNELVGKMVMAIRNDPSIESIDVSPRLFGTISSTLLEQFVRSLRINLHLKSLTFSGVELGNDFLYSLATSMESNIVLEVINLSNNLFTNEGLAEFCQIVAVSNDTLKLLNLENQTTPVSKASEDCVLDAFQKNKTLKQVKLDFQSKEASKRLAGILNKKKGDCPIKTSTDKKLLNLLRLEANRTQRLLGDHDEGDSLFDTAEKDWDHIYQLSVLFDKHKLNKHVQETSADFVSPTQRMNGDSMTKEGKKFFLFGAFQKSLGESITCLNSNGSFLTAEFISNYFLEDAQSDGLTFDFHGQWKLFKRFPAHDPSRPLIVSKFVDAIATHPRAGEITAINMANTGCGDDFLIGLASRCLSNESILPSLLILNFETNFIKGDGIVALAKVIESRTSLKFLQVIRLENQKCLHKSEAELALAKAMRVNFSIVAMSLSVRSLMERQQITKYLLRNVELLRQARQQHFKATGIQRERNEVEKLFDRIAENDDKIDTVDLVGNNRFLTLTPEEKTRAANAFATNTNIKFINFNSCGIDDEFAINLANSLKRNATISKVLLEGNAISGAGITALFKALAENSSIEELKLHKQSKTMSTSEEHMLADILQPNTALTKLGIDLRTTMAQVQLDKKLNLNRNVSLKLRAESKGETFRPSDTLAFIRF